MSAESAVVESESGRGLRRKRRPYHLFESIPTRQYVLIALLSFAAIFGLWAIASYGKWVDNLFLPTPTQVWNSAVSYAADGTMWQDIKVSVTRILLGFLLSTVVAIPVGVLMGVNKKFEAAVEPPVDFIRYMPAVAFIPLTLIWFGTTETQKIVILFIGVFFQEVLLIMDNVKNVPRPLVDMAYTLGLSQWRTIWKVVVPASLPGIVDTLRICMGWAWTYLVVVELVGANDGLGFRIQSAQRYLDTPQILIGIVIIGVLGLGFDFAFKALYRWAFPYLSVRGK